MVPPMRPRAGTTLMLSTVANTAFSSATDRGATSSVSARAGGVPAISGANNASNAKAVNPRIDMFAIMNSPTGVKLIFSAFPARSLTCLKAGQFKPA